MRPLPYDRNSIGVQISFESFTNHRAVSESAAKKYTVSGGKKITMTSDGLRCPPLTSTPHDATGASHRFARQAPTRKCTHQFKS
jgi:hypothetical protein